MMWGYGYGPAGMGLLGGGFMMLFWIAVLVGVALLVSRGLRHGAVGCCGTHVAPVERQTRGGQAEAVASERYARGEITRDEYLEITKTLNS